MRMNIGRTIVGEKFLVSTVDAWGTIETMVFECDAAGEVSSWTEKDCRRYASIGAARKGHKEMVQKWEQNA